jgi:hypothetical protein
MVDDCSPLSHIYPHSSYLSPSQLPPRYRTQYLCSIEIRTFVATSIALRTTLLAGLYAVDKAPDVATPLVLSFIETRKVSLHVVQYTVDDEAICAALELMNYLVTKQLHPHVISMSITLLIQQVDVDEVRHITKSAVVGDVVAVVISIGESLFTEGLCYVRQQRSCYPIVIRHL